MKSFFRSSLVVTVLGALIWAYMALCGRTIRWKIEGLQQAKTDWHENDAIIVTAWHSTILTLPTAWTRYMRRWPGRRAPSAMMISLSADGEPVARAIKHLGLDSIRGSSGYKRKRKDKGGGAAITQATQLLKSGGAVCMTPDGPRGPRQRSGLGPILIAKRAGATILPYALATAPSKRLASWDRFQIPIPFARGAIVFGEALRMGDESSPEALRLSLETRLNEATLRAEALSRAPHIAPARPVASKHTKSAPAP